MRIRDPGEANQCGYGILERQINADPGSRRGISMRIQDPVGKSMRIRDPGEANKCGSGILERQINADSGSRRGKSMRIRDPEEANQYGSGINANSLCPPKRIIKNLSRKGGGIVLLLRGA